MKRIAVSTIAVIGLVLGLLGTAQAGTDPFLGGWRSIDTDGSHQSLMIKALGPGMDSHFGRDTYASVCGGEPAKLQGRGAVDGSIFSGTMDLRCPNGIHFHDLTFWYEYDPSTDSLFDGFVTWYRVPG